MFCHSCQVELSPTDIFCGKCGSKIITTAMEPQKNISSVVEPQNIDLGSNKISKALMDEITNLVRIKRNKILAIKILRENTGMGLKKAKDIIDNL